MEPKSKKTILVGYGITQKGYRVWDPERNCIYTARDCVIDEKEIGLDKSFADHDYSLLDDIEGKEYEVECIVKERLHNGQ